MDGMNTETAMQSGPTCKISMLWNWYECSDLFSHINAQNRQVHHWCVLYLYTVAHSLSWSVCPCQNIFSVFKLIAVVCQNRRVRCDYHRNLHYRCWSRGCKTPWPWIWQETFSIPSIAVCCSSVAGRPLERWDYHKCSISVCCSFILVSW